jgi:glycosyltransferase involved in cell wall biosynthesis
VHDGDNGLLVPPQQVAPLAMALGKLIGDGDLRRAMGERGRARTVAEFSVEIVADETLRLYAELLGSNTPQVSRTTD